MARHVDDLVLVARGGRRNVQQGHYIHDNDTGQDVAGSFYSFMQARMRLVAMHRDFTPPDDATIEEFNLHLRPSVRPRHTMPDGGLLFPDGPARPLSDLLVGVDYGAVEARVLAHLTNPCAEIVLNERDIPARTGRTIVHPIRGRTETLPPGGRHLRYSMGSETFLDQINSVADNVVAGATGNPAVMRGTVGEHGFREGDQVIMNGQTFRVTGNVHDSVSLEPVEKEEPLTMQQPTGVRALSVYTDDEAGLRKQVTDLEARVAELTEGWAAMIRHMMAGKLSSKKKRKHDRMITFKLQPKALNKARGILERMMGDEVHRQAAGDTAGGHPDKPRRDVRIS